MLAAAALTFAASAFCQDGAVAPAAPLAAGAEQAAPAKPRKSLFARFLARPAPAAAPAAIAWRALDDEDMRGVVAKGYASIVFAQSRLRPQPGAGQSGLGNPDLLLNPVLGMLSADILAKDVLYGAGGALPVWNADGSVTLALPDWVGTIDVPSIRVNAADDNSFGSVRVNAIDLSRTTITVRPK
ncbi:hypothetical protein [Janthinobacterium fluminis]|nr:hypothetical protein [Janthinobacterium fluminis]